MNVKDEVVKLVKTLDQIEEYNNSLIDKLSNVDSKICDVMHLIESKKLKTNQCYRVIKELHKLRIERRKTKNDMELLKVFYTNQNKLLNKDFRNILLNNIGKTEKNLLNSQYKNRIYTEEEIEELIGG